MAVGKFAGHFHIQRPGLHDRSQGLGRSVIAQHLLLAPRFLERQIPNLGRILGTFQSLIQQLNRF